MIEESLKFLKEELLNYLANDIGDPGADIDLGNIALFETDKSNTIEDKLIITLVNIEEESALKNNRNFQKRLSGGIQYIAPSVYLNLYLLFSCNYSLYTSSLKRLGHVIQFFQQRSSFNVNLATSSQNEGLFQEKDLDFKLTFELYTLTFEQINHLWGSLGGRQLPSVMYKARLVRIEDRQAFQVGPVIEELQNEVIRTNEYSQNEE